MNDTTVIQPFPTDLYEAARWFTSAGFALFPVKLTPYTTKEGHQKLEKQPLTNWGYESFADDFIIDLLNRSAGEPWNATLDTGLALGLNCGKSDLYILDVDCRASNIYPEGSPGMASLAALEAKYGALPQTWVSRTPSGGLHYWFRGHGRNSASSPELGAGLDTRGDGGFIVIPPSRVEDGTFYEWVNDPDIFALADAPEWLIELTAKKVREHTPGEYSGDFTTLDYDADIPDGKRNDTLFRYACAWRAEGRDEDEIFARLVIVNDEKCQPPLEKHELQQVAWSAMRYDPDPEQVRKAQINETLEELSGAFLEQQARLHEQLRQQEEAAYQQWDEDHPDKTPWDQLNELDQTLRVAELDQEIEGEAQVLDREDRGAVNDFRLRVLQGYWKGLIPQEVIEKVLDKRVPLPQEKSTDAERDDQLMKSAKVLGLILTRDVRTLLEEQLIKTQDLYAPAFLEELIKYIYEPLQWKYALKFFEKMGMDKEQVYNILEDYYGAQSWKDRLTADICALPQERHEWVVDGIFPATGASLFTAAPKAGKSTTVRWLSYCVAAGYPWLGFPTKKTRVCYVGIEESDYAIQTDFTDFQRSYGAFDREYHNTCQGVPNKRTFLQLLEQKLVDGYKFIILDLVIDCIQLLNANDYSQVNTALKPLRRLALKYGAHIMCVHHANREGAFLGSQAFKGFGDANLELSGKDEEPRFMKLENRVPKKHGGRRFENLHIILNDDNSNRVGYRKEMSEKLKQTLLLLQKLFALITLLLKSPDTKWVVGNTREEMTVDTSFFSNTLLPAAERYGVIHPLPTKRGVEKPIILMERYAGMSPEDYQIYTALLSELSTTESADDIATLKAELNLTEPVC